VDDAGSNRQCRAQDERTVQAQFVVSSQDVTVIAVDINRS
jgi:hypothetical protein